MFNVSCPEIALHFYVKLFQVNIEQICAIAYDGFYLANSLMYNQYKTATKMFLAAVLKTKQRLITNK